MPISDYKQTIPYPIWGITGSFSAANTWNTLFANNPATPPTTIIGEECPENVKSIVILNLMAGNPIVVFTGTYADFNNGAGAPGPTLMLSGEGKTLIPQNSSLTIDIGVEGNRSQIGLGSLAGLSNNRINFFMFTTAAPVPGTPQFSITLVTSRGSLGV